MKLLMLAAIALFSIISLKAQENRLFKRKPWEEYKLKRLLSDTLSRIIPHAPSLQNQPSPVQPGVVKFPLKGNYIGDNENGDQIYAMRPDNMPCLIPGKNTLLNMPVAGGLMLHKKAPDLPNMDENNNDLPNSEKPIK